MVASEAPLRYAREVDLGKRDSLGVIASMIASGSSVLDLGAGTGALGGYLTAQKNCRADAIELDTERANIARQYYDALYQIDLESTPLAECLAERRYDSIVCADIVEHLRDPSRFLCQLPSLLTGQGSIYLAIPNLCYLGLMGELLSGQFQYRSEGLLDDTHLRFFTLESLVELLKESGLAVKCLERVIVDPKDSEFNEHLLNRYPPRLQAYLQSMPEALTYQFIIEAIPTCRDEAVVKDWHSSGPVSLPYTVQCYWQTNIEPGFMESQSLTISARLTEDYDQVIPFSLPDGRFVVNKVRLDPSDRPGVQRLKQLNWVTSTGTEYPVPIANMLTNGQLACLNLVMGVLDNGDISLLSLGDDPWFEIPVPSMDEVGGSPIVGIRLSLSWPQTTDFIALKEQYQSVDARISELTKQVHSLTHAHNSAVIECEKANKLNTELLTKLDVLSEEQERLIAALAVVDEYKTSANNSLSRIGNQLKACIFKGVASLMAPIHRQFQQPPQKVSFTPIGEVIDDITGEYQKLFIGDKGGYRLEFPLLNSQTGFYDFSVDYSSDIKLIRPFLIFGNEEKGFLPGDIRFLWDLEQGSGSAIVKLPSEPTLWDLYLSKLDTRVTFDSVNVRPLSRLEVCWRTQRVAEFIQQRRWSLAFQAFIGFIAVMSGRGELGSFRWGFDHLTPDQWWRRHARVSTLRQLYYRQRGKLFRYQPKISIIVPVYNVDEVWLRKAIDSVLAQTYTNWQLCIADDASPKPHVRRILQEYQEADKRIEVVFREQNGHISLASNSALEIASGEFVTFLDHDDELSVDALHQVVACLNENPELNFIYSDEDLIYPDGEHGVAHFKPDWNPELLHSINYVCHLAVYRKTVIDAVGGFRQGVEGSQDFDLLLRASLTLEEGAIAHIPRILYHWRAIPGSTAYNLDEKDYATAAGIKALTDYYAALERPVEVTQGATPTTYRVKHSLPEQQPSVGLVIPTHNGYGILKKTIESILQKTSYGNYHVYIVNNRADDPSTLNYLASVEEYDRVTVLQYDHPFNFSAINNFAVEHVDAELIGLINNDIEVRNDDWLDEMVSWAIQPETGAVGAKLSFMNECIQHGGVVLGLGPDLVAGHSHKGFASDSPGYFGRLQLLQNFSAVTAACLLVRKELYQAVGGLNAENLSVAYNDVDFCLRLRELGYRNVWTPYAELYHFESISRGYEVTPEKRARFQREKDYMLEVWPELIERDPAYNPNLTRDYEDFRLSDTPRRVFRVKHYLWRRNVKARLHHWLNRSPIK